MRLELEHIDSREEDLSNIIKLINDRFDSIVLASNTLDKKSPATRVSKEVVKSNDTVTKRVKGKNYRFGKSTASTVKNNTLFVDSTDNVLKFKDDAGNIAPVSDLSGLYLGINDTAVNSAKLDNLDSSDFARYSSGGTISGLANGAWVTSSNGSTNVDHVWHDDSYNEWNFVSDSTFQSAGNSKIRAGKLALTSLPTSSSGLSSGDLWNNGGVVNIVP
jgi:hypothetical protein